MSLDGTRLQGTIYQATKTQLVAAFGDSKEGLSPAEKVEFDLAMDKFALAIGNGDGLVTVAEFTANAETSTPGA